MRGADAPSSQPACVADVQLSTTGPSARPLVHGSTRQLRLGPGKAAVPSLLQSPAPSAYVNCRLVLTLCCSCRSKLRQPNMLTCLRCVSAHDAELRRRPRQLLEAAGTHCRLVLSAHERQPLAAQDYDGSGRVPKGASNGGGAYRPPPSRRGMGAMTDDSSGDERSDRKRSRPKANSLAVRIACGLSQRLSKSSHYPPNAVM